MATKTISVDLEAYQRLSAARLSEKESFSKVIRRAVWLAKAGTAGDLLNRTQDSESTADIALLDEAQEADSPTIDPWDAN